MVGGAWERRMVRPLGLRASVVPSGWRVSCQPRRWMQTSWWNLHTRAQLAAEEGQPDAQALLGTVLSLGPEEMRELVIDAWRMVVPKKVAAAQLAADDARYPT